MLIAVLAAESELVALLNLFALESNARGMATGVHEADPHIERLIAYREVSTHAGGVLEGHVIMY